MSLQKSITITKAATKAVDTVKNTAASTKKTVVNAANAYKENWNSGISQLQSSGTAGKIFESYSEGVVQNLSNTASGTVQLVKDPLGTVNESVNYFLEDPLKNNPVAAVGRYYQDIAQASYAHDWETVANKVGSGTATVAEVGVTCYALKGAGKCVNTAKNKITSTLSKSKSAKPVYTPSRAGISSQNKYALT